MDFLEYIKILTDEELELAIKDKIEFLEQISYKQNEGTDTIGYELGYNPSIYDLINDSNDIDITITCIYKGYIKKGLRMVYGIAEDNYGVCSNDGRYYYIDEDSYILDFCKYIRNKEVVDEFDLFKNIFSFMKDYFKYSVDNISRENMFKMIYSSNILSYPLTNEHGFSWFKGRGNARCSERSLVAENILSIFGFESYIVIGRESDYDGIDTAHAFNFVKYKEKETNEELNTLIDFSIYASVFNINGEEVEKVPYVGFLNRLNDSLFRDLLCEDLKLEFYEFEYLRTNDKDLLIYFPNKLRTYYLDGKGIEKKKIKIGSGLNE